MKNSHIENYIHLLTHFVNGDISSREFESQYLSLFKNETEIFSESIFSILDKLFGDIDSFCSDESLIQPGDLNEKQLIESAKQSLKALNQLLKR